MLRSLVISAKTAIKLTDLSDTRWVCRWRNVNVTRRSLNILIMKSRKFEQLSSRGQWLVGPNAATRVHCVLGRARLVLSQVQLIHALLQRKTWRWHRHQELACTIVLLEINTQQWQRVEANMERGRPARESCHTNTENVELRIKKIQSSEQKYLRRHKLYYFKSKFILSSLFILTYFKACGSDQC